MILTLDAKRRLTTNQMVGNAELDTRLDIAAPWGPVTGIVSALPFIKRR